eukprot:COSAG02_NODE_64_length_43111_cov_35.627709_18_plen_86_part_00
MTRAIETESGSGMELCTYMHYTYKIYQMTTSFLSWTSARDTAVSPVRSAFAHDRPKLRGAEGAVGAVGAAGAVGAVGAEGSRAGG